MQVFHRRGSRQGIVVVTQNQLGSQQRQHRAKAPAARKDGIVQSPIENDVVGHARKRQVLFERKLDPRTGVDAEDCKARGIRHGLLFSAHGIVTPSGAPGDRTPW